MKMGRVLFINLGIQNQIASNISNYMSLLTCIFVNRRFKFVQFATTGNIASKVTMKYN